MFTKINKKEKSMPCDSEDILRGENSKVKNFRGFSLVEMLIYVAATAILLLVLSVIFVRVYGLYKEITLVPRTDRSALLVVDRIVKDIRSGQNINQEESSFRVDSGILDISAVESATIVKKHYALDDGRITYQEDNGAVNYLTPSDIEVTKFKLTYLTTDISEGVRVEIDVVVPKKEEVIKEYDGFAILRQSYE